MSDIFLTQKGYEQLKANLDEMKGPRRRDIAQHLAKARSMGDLTENAEYDAAKEAQVHLERQIVDLEDNLARARIIENEDIPADKVYIGATVQIKDLDTDEECVYTLVSPPEADFDEKKISLESPIGKGLMGHAENDEVVLEVPAGTLRYKILKITRA